METFELPDKEWDQVVLLMNAQVEARGLDPSDLGTFTEVLKKDWFLFVDDALRDRMLEHRTHQRLSKAANQTEKQARDTERELRNLPPDPGPPTTR